MLAMEAPMTREERLEEALQDIMQLCTAYPLMQSKARPEQNWRNAARRDRGPLLTKASGTSP